MKVAVAETAAEFAEKFAGLPAQSIDWTDQLLPASERRKYVTAAMSELERDRLVSILRGVATGLG